jgi:dolichol-phosphate mannosyltransferase
MEDKKRNLVSVILPTYNEKDNIKEMIKQLLFHLKNNAEIIVSDDNSPDGTWKIVQRLSKKNKSIRLIRRFKNKGVGPSIMDGIKKSNGKYVAWMDCDLTMPPSLVPKMVSLLDDNDVVVGSRYAKGGKDNRSFIRVTTSRLINLFANIVLNFKVKDYDSGFVAARREVLDKVKFNPKGHGEYCIEFLYKCTRKGYKIKEVGYVFTERKLGESKTSQYVYSVFLYGINYIKRIINVRLNS